MDPTGIHCVIPSRLGIGETFSVKLRALGAVYKASCKGQWNTLKPALHGPFNLNVEREIQYLDNCLPEWIGRLEIDGGAQLTGPSEVVFDGVRQGVFRGDRRPIGVFDGFSWSEPGFQFIKVIDPVSGVHGWSNPVLVTPDPPATRLFWGDPHWQTFFSDGIRCPEELYAFARDEAFLDFGAITDHVEALTDRQWDYFTGVTNDYNAPGHFVTLVGQEWTKHNPGHRNIYFRGAQGPILRCTDTRYDSLDKLWQALDGLDAVAVPHHTSNKIMGVDWDAGWNPRYEKAVEIYSVWGNSECHADDGNPRPIQHCQGEVHGRHVLDALRRGYRFGFMGGGDIHDGRPGDGLSYLRVGRGTYAQGLTAAFLPELTRGAIFDAICGQQTYATTHSRIYLDVRLDRGQRRLTCETASEEGVAAAVVVVNGDQHAVLAPEHDHRTIRTSVPVPPLDADDFLYVRVVTDGGNMAWSSPFWGQS